MKKLDTHFLILLFEAIARRLEESRDQLCALDGEIGDGDHGTSMANGFAAVADLGRKSKNAAVAPGAYMEKAANAFLCDVGATVGPLYSTAMLHAAQFFGDRQYRPLSDLDSLLQAFADGIVSRGNARQGDKTMLDAWLPAVRAAQDATRSGAAPGAVIRQATDAARRGAEATATMIASRGRAARLNERSLGKLDPGAISAVVILEAFSDAVEAVEREID